MHEDTPIVRYVYMYVCILMCACYTQMYTHVCTQRVCTESLHRETDTDTNIYLQALLLKPSLYVIHTYVYICVYKHVCMLYTNVYTRLYAKISTQMCTQMYTRIFVHKCIHKCIHMSVCEESLHWNTGTDTDMYLQASLLLKPSRQIIRELFSADCFAFSQFFDA